MSPSLIARVLRAAADECDRVAAEQHAERRDWIGQRESPLGNRRHCAAVGARLAAGKPGAAIVGRRHLLSAEALEEELAGGAKRRPGVGADLRAALSLVGGGRRG